MGAMLTSHEFWIGLGQIIMINILLSGDNAVVIALASRALPAKQQKQVILLGSAGAIVLRVILTFFAVMLLALPFLKLAGAAALGWIGADMLVNDEDEAEIASHGHMWGAIRTVIVADLIMSLDNVLGVAAAAKGNLVLLILGLGISVPLIIYGSQMILKLMERFPFIITLGAALLGWVAGEMAVGDPAVKDWIDANMPILHQAVPTVGAILVVLAGRWLNNRARAAHAGKVQEAVAVDGEARKEGAAS